MAVNQFGQTYQGADDFRGYLAGNGYGGLLSYTGNDGGIDANAAAAANYAGYTAPFARDYKGAQTYVSGLYNTWNSQRNGVLGSSYVDGGGFGTSGGATGPTAAEKQQYADFTNKSYDTKIAGLQSIFDTLNPQEDAARLNVNNQWQNQSNALQGQKAIGDRNLTMAGEEVQGQKVKSLADLGRQMQTMGMSYANQLGSYGAGDSSASQMINQALSGMASKNRANVLGSASKQETAIGLQKQDLEMEYGNNMKALDDWKSTSLNDIATKFLQQRQSLQQQMAGANADKAQALAQIDASYVQRAMDALSAVENQYRQGASELINQYKNITSPNANISEGLQQFAVNPISAGKLSQLGNVPVASTGNTVTPYAQRRGFDEDYGFGI